MKITINGMNFNCLKNAKGIIYQEIKEEIVYFMDRSFKRASVIQTSTLKSASNILKTKNY